MNLSVPMRVVLFASGRGSNVEAILTTAQQHPALLRVVGVVTNNPDAAVVEIAKQYAIPSFVVRVTRLCDALSTRLDHERRILNILSTLEWDWMCLAGYMRILTRDFVERFPHPVWPVSRILNIHPSLLPAFKGMSAYEQAFESGVTTSGVTVHFVSHRVDEGIIIAQETVLILPTDTLADFKARGLRVEHRLYSKVLLALANGQWAVSIDPFQIRVGDEN